MSAKKKTPKEIQQERQAIKGRYKHWAKDETMVYNDLIEAATKMRDNLRYNSDMGVLVENDSSGKPSVRTASSNERLKGYDNATGIDMVLNYIKRQLS